MSRIKQLTGAFIAPKKAESEAAKPKLEGFRPAPQRDEFKKGPAYACSAPFNPVDIKPPGGGFYACRAEIPGDGKPPSEPPLFACRAEIPGGSLPKFSCATDCFPDAPKDSIAPGPEKPIFVCAATDCFPDAPKDSIAPSLEKPIFVCAEVGGQAVLGRQWVLPPPWHTEGHGYDPP